MYATYYPVVKYFKDHYQGKIILKADANSQWVGKLINPSTPQYTTVTLSPAKELPCKTTLPKKWRRPIADKKILEDYYAKAKIFVTTSYREGGSPNVVAEALRNGCYLVTSKIDAWQDTFAPEAGASFDHDDLVALSTELKQAMSDSKLCQQAFTLNRAYVQAELSYEQQVSRLETLLKVRGKLNDKN